MKKMFVLFALVVISALVNAQSINITAEYKIEDGSGYFRLINKSETTIEGVLMCSDADASDESIKATHWLVEPGYYLESSPKNYDWRPGNKFSFITFEGVYIWQFPEVGFNYDIDYEEVSFIFSPKDYAEINFSLVAKYLNESREEALRKKQQYQAPVFTPQFQTTTPSYTGSKAYWRSIRVSAEMNLRNAQRDLESAIRRRDDAIANGNYSVTYDMVVTSSRNLVRQYQQNYDYALQQETMASD